MRSDDSSGKRLILVQDDGPGLPPELLGSFGNAFVGHNASAGIGVYHTKQLLHAVGWKFEVKQEKGLCIEIMPAETAG